MDEELRIGGYQCDFVGPVPEELVCKSCKLVAREPHLAGCCEARFCHGCIDPVLKDKKQCPSCCEVDEFSIVFTKSSKKKILTLQVCCDMKQRGCEWVAQLVQLDAHLDTDCQYVDVECPSKCDQKVQKRNLATHLKDDCPKREYMCPHCNFKATFAIVSNIHWPECSYLPLRCPNQCGVTCEREIMEDHMQLCSLEEIECALSFAGCKEKFLRQDQDGHMKGNSQRHLELMATATVKMQNEKDQQIRELLESHKQVQQQLQEKDTEMKRELQKRDKAMKDYVKRELKKRDDELKLKLEEKDQQVRQSATEVTALKKQLQEANERLSKEINDFRTAAGIPPYHWTMANFAELKRENTYWDSELFYTHPNGYQCYIKVWANGAGEGYGSHVTVQLYPVEGEFDAALPWPAKATITLQLLNQHRDHERWSVIKRVEWRKPSLHVIHVIDYSRHKFVPHTELGWNARKHTHYLKDDCLRFRIAEIQIHTIPSI